MCRALDLPASFAAFLLVSACGSRGTEASTWVAVSVPRAATDAGASDAERAKPDTATQPRLSDSSGIVARQCGRPSYDLSWTLDASAPGVTCHEQADCSDQPRGHCLGFTDCDASAAGSACDHVIRSTRCLYDACASDADCATGQQCVCPQAGGDPWCVVDGCDEDGDCPAGQHCQGDHSVRGVGPLEHCTTLEDTCGDQADCGDPDSDCGYDTQAHHWSCGPITIMD